jgi:hypothetical protein
MDKSSAQHINDEIHLLHEFYGRGKNKIGEEHRSEKQHPGPPCSFHRTWIRRLVHAYTRLGFTGENLDGKKVVDEVADMFGRGCGHHSIDSFAADPHPWVRQGISLLLFGTSGPEFTLISMPHATSGGLAAP